MTAGTVVEFLENGEFFLAFVTGGQAGKGLECLGQNGRIIRLSPGRILISQAMEDPQAQPLRLSVLKEVQRIRTELSRSVPLEELWTVLDGEGPDFEYDLLAGLAFGREPGPDEISAVRRSVQADGIYFSFTPQTAKRHTREEADKKRKIQTQKKAQAEFLGQGGRWLADSVKGKAAPEPKDSERVVRVLEDLAVREDQAFDLKTARDLLKEANLPESAQGALEALIAVGHFRVHENIELRRLNLGHDFTEEEVKTARELAGNFKIGQEERMDLTSLEVTTIDSAGTKEFDDGFSLVKVPGGFRLGLHIADVAALIEPGSVLDRAAETRASSVYLPDGKYPMLPPMLTESVLSLKAGEDRPAFSLMVDLDSYGHLKSYFFTPSVIRVKRQMSFDQADELLPLDSLLSQGHELGLLLLNRRLEFGGQNLNLPQLQVRLSPAGEIQAGTMNWNTPAKVMVGEMMILANHLAAEALNQASLPCPYRFQEKPRARRGAEFEPKNDRQALALDLAARRQLGRGGLTFSPAPHWGLGLSVYTQFTSPIRRYADLLVARQLRALKNPEAAPYNRVSLMEKAVEADELHRSIRRMQTARERYFLTALLENKIGGQFTALVFERSDQRTRVCLTDYMVEFDLFKLPPEVRPGRDIFLKLTQANARLQVLKFEFLGLA